MTSKQWQSIVVAVGDPSRKQHIALKKAAGIAQRCDASLTLLHTFAFPYPVQTRMSSKAVLRHTADTHRERLERLAKPLHKRGIKVQCAVEWDFPPHEAIVRYALKHRADLVVAETHRQRPLGRWLLSNTDWELIRACPIPLWFVKNAALPVSVEFFAAVDPMHARAKSSQLDAAIVAFAQQAVARIGGRVKLAHAYEEPLAWAPGMLMEPVRLPLPPQHARDYVAATRAKVDALAKRYRISVGDTLVKEGDPSYVLPSMITRRAAQVIVMGAVSRSGLARTFIGNTAERVLDHLECDVIVVKQRGFKTAVPKRHAHLLKY